MDYIEVTITLEPLRPWNDILVAELADLGFESFIEIENYIFELQSRSRSHLGVILLN